MEEVRQYLLSVTSAAVLCGIVNGIAGKKNAYGTIVKFITGLAVMITCIAPLTKINISDLPNIPEYFMDGASEYVTEGKTVAQIAASDIIKSNTEAYILDKATAMGLELSVAVSLSEESPPIPKSVQIHGQISPYSRELMANWITDNLGIAKEEQQWI